MEALFKKYFWVLRGVGVAAVVALAASTFTTYFGASFLYVEEEEEGAGTGGETDTDGDEEDDDERPASSLSASPSRASSRKGRSESDKNKMLTTLAGANLFCPSCAPPPPPEPVLGPGGVVPSVEIDLGAGPPGGIQPGEVRTGLPLKLVVTMESTDARYSQATLLHTETGSVRPYWPGDTISPGVVLVAVERGLIHIRNNAQSEYLELGAEVPPPKPKAKSKKKEEKADEGESKVPGAEDSIKCDTEDSCTVDRAFVESLFANPMALAKQARVVPAVVDGETKGFKFYGIRSGSLPKLLGLKNGDTLTSVNGNEVKTVDDAMSLVAKLRQASNLSIAIERKGKTITKEITIK